MSSRRGTAARFALAACAVGLPFVAATPAPAQTLVPTLLQKFEQRTESSSASTPVAVGTTAYFVADDGVHGHELHKTDGTPGGTALVTDLRAGPDGSDIDRTTMVAFAGSLYFIASSTPDERELWKSDGTAAGTTLVRTLGSVSNAGGPMAVAGDTLFFAAQDAANGSELWATNGTAQGTRLVQDVQPGAGSSEPFSFARLGTTGKVVFYADDGAHGYEPWVSDGTGIGTTLLKDVVPGTGSSSGNQPGMLSVGTGKAAFMANQRELWATDGTAAGTLRVALLPTSPQVVAAAGSRLVLNLYESQSGTFAPWVSDLTAAGVSKLDVQSVSPNDMVSDGTSVWFAGLEPGVDGGAELYRTDGTAAGTSVVQTVPGPTGAIFYDVAPLGAAGGRVFFRFRDETHGTELWSVPTSGGTPTLVKDLAPGERSTSLSYRGAALGSTLLLPLDDDVSGLELWRTDGTAGGTALLADLNTDATDATEPFDVAIGEKRAFSLVDTRNRRELHVTDGTPGGSRLVMAVAHGGDRGIGRPALIGDVAYFTVATENGTVTLWRSDGTEAGTTPLRTLPGSSPYWQPFASGDAIYFGTSDQGNTRGGPPPASTLWRTDGTAAGTVTLDTPGLRQLEPVAMLGSTLLVRATTDAAGTELHAIDGPGAQPRLVRDIVTGTDSGYPSRLVVAGAKAYFTADTGAAGNELWVTDGTTDGTHLVADILAGADGAEPQDLTPAGDRVFFTADAADGSTRLTYVTGGTEQGAKPVSADRLKTGTSPSSLTAFGEKLVYRADGVDHEELYVTDGTDSGTFSLGKLDDYYGDEDMQAVDGRVYFRSEDDEHGRELWSTDGTVAGTRFEADLLAGGAGSNPALFGELRDGLLLSPYDFTIGRSMMRYGAPIVDEQPQPPTPEQPGPPAVTPAGPVATAPAAPKPAAPRAVVSRPAPTSAKLTTTKVQRDAKLPYRFVFTGKLGVPKGVGRKAACKGEVVATLKRGARTVRTAEGRLAKDCTFKVVVRIATLKGLSRTGGRLDVKLRFTGNATLRPMNAGTTTVRYGG